MNETEAEARRLLSAATSDLPDGIDLLDGFSRARARRKRGRVAAAVGATSAVAVAATVLALTAGSAPPAHPAVATPSRAPAVDALTAVTRALNSTTSAQSFSDTNESGIYYIATDGKVYARSGITCTGEQDPAQGLAESYCPGDSRSFEVGGYYYYNTHEHGSTGAGAKYWWAIRSSGLGNFPPEPAITGLANDTPQKIVSVIKAGAKVTVVGPVSGSGWTGTRYAFTWTATTGKDGTDPVPPETISGTVDVDQQGRARYLAYNDKMTGGNGTAMVRTYDMGFSDFGIQVTITAPPANQVYILNPPQPKPTASKS
jgi:hypothetical protein